MRQFDLDLLPRPIHADGGSARRDVRQPHTPDRPLPDRDVSRGKAAPPAGNPTLLKREVNELMRASLRLRDERIAFFCECADASCYQAVWLTCAEYDEARADPEWLALVGGHQPDRPGAGRARDRRN